MRGMIQSATAMPPVDSQPYATRFRWTVRAPEGGERLTRQPVGPVQLQRGDHPEQRANDQEQEGSDGQDQYDVPTRGVDAGTQGVESMLGRPFIE
ncbi:hypothetical protein [Pseudomonas aeruginosa]|uniref:hypothetical protein n=1 Tax=Pseudomonas aeruginosa TaxID=287 RepID=UPI001EDABAF6|nr:hypothetical protein [Pseudomonas aeruginosa]MCG3044791.1 hypothetical protein [Pseudomonas aeruginosa]